MGKSADAILGKSTAEEDVEMLATAFYESQDYLTLANSSDKQIVVGRRGSGKSALFYGLTRVWEKENRVRIIKIVPPEDQVIGLRATVSGFGDSYMRIRAGAKIAWKYALLTEMALAAVNDYKAKAHPSVSVLMKHCNSWRNPTNVCARLRKKLDSVVNLSLTAERRIASLSEALNLEELQFALRDCIEASGLRYCLLLDSLDEGYEPDPVGTGLIGGLVMAMLDLPMLFPSSTFVTFLRDALYRAIRRDDRDFSRNIEPKILRLSWNEPELLNLVSVRLKVAFNIDADSPLKVWNACAAHGLENLEGFRKCLSLTLYRPRDLLSLLNRAFGRAKRQNSDRIVLDNIRESALDISKERQEDLVKEYIDVVPGLSQFIKALSNRQARISYSEACQLMDGVFADIHEPQVQQDLEAISDSEEVVKILYGTGVLGVLDESAGTFVFSHDGKGDGINFDKNTEFLVHPSYWMGLNISEHPLERAQAQEIHDEYDPEVSTESGQIRQKNLSHSIAALSGIPVGDNGALQFEEWCLKAVRLAFAGHLRNCELKPNAAATTQRDILGRNMATGCPWDNLRNSYGVEQVIFEVKNYERPTIEDFSQLLSYLGKQYGRAGFFITRGESHELRRGSTELNQVQHLFNQHRSLVVILTANWFNKVLSKLRNPARHEYGSDLLAKLIDTYLRKYVKGQGRARNR